jgi:hypothetical protein
MKWGIDSTSMVPLLIILFRTLKIIIGVTAEIICQIVSMSWLEIVAHFEL